MNRQYNMARWILQAQQLIAWLSTSVNKAIQFICFAIFLMYYYKYKTNVVEDTVPRRLVNKQLIRIGIMFIYIHPVHGKRL